MNRTLPTAALLILAAFPASAQIDAKFDRALRSALPVCSDAKLTLAEFPAAVKLPVGFKGVIAKVESARVSCAGDTPAVYSPTGAFYLGMPWLIANEEGATAEEKVKNFIWRNLQQTVTVELERKPNDIGLWDARIVSMTEAGKVPLKGSLTPDGRLFFFGGFRKPGEEIPVQRVRAFAPFIAAAPSKGAADAPVTIVEFSDFQCPACRHASSYADAVVAAHPDKVRYVRVDLPLEGHAWAFPASLAGRVIAKQKPEAFWAYKKQVYESQDELNSFVIWDWARSFADSQGLDMAKYDADLAAADEIRKLLLDGVGAAFTNDVRATPTFMVNGVFVDYGEDGKALAAHVASLLK